MPTAMGLTDKPGPVPKTFLLERGELANKGVEVQPGFPAILSSASKAVAAVHFPLPASTLADAGRSGSRQ